MKFIDDIADESPKSYDFKKVIIIIIVLVVVVAVGIPIVLKLVNKEEETYEEKIKKLVLAIDNYVDTKGYDKPVTFVFNDGDVIPTLEIDVYKPTSGSITILNENGYILNQISNGTLCISKNGDLEDLKAVTPDECENLSSLIPTISDSGQNGDGNANNGGGSKTGKDSETPKF